MTWFKVDDKFHSNMKVIAAGNAAVGLYVRCGAWTSEAEQEGRIPKRVARMYGSTREIAKLLEVRLWADMGDHYLMPDFLEYNPSAEELAERRAKRSESGRQGGIKSGQSRRSKAEANGEANASVSGSKRGSKNEPRTRPVPDPTRPPSVSNFPTNPKVAVRGIGGAVGEEAIEAAVLMYAVIDLDGREGVGSESAYAKASANRVRMESGAAMAEYLHINPDAVAWHLAYHVLGLSELDMFTWGWNPPADRKVA